MNVRWTPKALLDVARLYDFLAPINKEAAVKIIQAIVATPNGLREHPRIGESLEEFRPREVRRILVGRYEIRYEIKDSTIRVLRVWYTRENR